MIFESTTVVMIEVLLTSGYRRVGNPLALGARDRQFEPGYPDYFL